MWLTRNNPKNRTANPLVQDPKMEAAMNAITEKNELHGFVYCRSKSCTTDNGRDG